MTTTKKAAKKSGATTKTTTRRSKASSTLPVTKTKAAAGDCPRGGAHDWVDGDEGRHCTKCLEPALRKKTGGKTPTNPFPRRLSAIDAAAKVLSETSESLTAQQLIDAMTTKGYWTSPGGKTPQATVYSAILREIASKGAESRFKKTERGHFANNG